MPAGVGVCWKKKKSRARTQQIWGTLVHFLMYDITEDEGKDSKPAPLPWGFTKFRDCPEQLISINPWNPNRISIKVQKSPCMLTSLRVPLPENTQQSCQAWCQQGSVASECLLLLHFIIRALKSSSLQIWAPNEIMDVEVLEKIETATQMLVISIINWLSN